MALPRGTSYVILAVLTMPAMISSENEGKRHKFDVNFTAGLPNKVCPRLRDSACWRSGEITQPRTSLIREPCIQRSAQKFDVNSNQRTNWFSN